MLNAGVVVPGQPNDSELIDRVTSVDEKTRMPPEGHPLKPEQITKLKAWIEQGAKVPPDDAPEPDPRNHWSFRTPQRPVVPAIGNAPAAIRNPIDAFIAAKWTENCCTDAPKQEQSNPTPTRLPHQPQKPVNSCCCVK